MTPRGHHDDGSQEILTYINSSENLCNAHVINKQQQK